MPFNDSNKDKEKKNSQTTRSGDCAVFAHLATQQTRAGDDRNRAVQVGDPPPH
jgi:hypothetical protein